ncbi:MAG TPA: leucyl aminopeptidase [Pyrinomonadaceae bacterium]|nr:leucyl aminopeptidase [Pyrinomonadaceae bacterium]
MDKLNVQIANEIPPPATGEAIALCVFEGDSSPIVADEKLTRPLEALLRDGDFKGEAETHLLVHAAGDAGARLLLLLGMGERGDNHPEEFARAAGTAVRQARGARVRHLVFVLPSCPDEVRVARAVAEGAHMGLYDNDLYTNRDEEKPALERLTLVAARKDDEFHDSLGAAVERARIIAESANWARKLSDEPGLSLPPREFARRAAEMAGEFGLRVETLSADEIAERGMGGLSAVGQGSDEPPALIVLRYEPEGASPDDELWAFVGKGITFDTGGISLKRGPGMEEMKSDMAGGAAVLGALRAVAQLKPARRVVGIVPAAENMPSGRAVKPGDVVRTLAGYNVEVVDTDAEGRLVLIDGIAYAKQLGAARIVDLATLTGSIIVALGDWRAGLFSNNDEWAEAVRRAAASAGEPAWRMPVGDDYKKLIESLVADFKNYGGRPDATGAALLLSKFAADTPWVHLDIAGTAWYDKPRPYAPKGSSGAGVRTLVELVCGSGS